MKEYYIDQYNVTVDSGLPYPIMIRLGETSINLTPEELTEMLNEYISDLRGDEKNESV